MKNELYELRKDVSTPTGYHRAGTQKSFEEWCKVFGNIQSFNVREWFLSMSEVENQKPIDMIDDEIERVFNNHKLRSISYKMAAKEVVLNIIDKLKKQTI